MKATRRAEADSYWECTAL